MSIPGGNPKRGRQGSVADRIARLKNRPLGVSPPRQKFVVVHRCFSQISGEAKPSECKCPQVTESEAEDLIRRDKADWLRVVRVKNGKTQKYSTHSAIVIKQTAEDVQTQKAIEYNKCHDAARTSYYTGIFLKWLARGVASGRFPHNLLISEAQVVEALKDVQEFQRRHPDVPADIIARLQKTEHDILLASEELTMTRGQFLPGAPSGKGELVTGGLDIEAIAAHWDENENGGRRVKVANYRPARGADGRWDYSQGADPDTDREHPHTDAGQQYVEDKVRAKSEAALKAAERDARKK